MKKIILIGMLLTLSQAHALAVCEIFASNEYFHLFQDESAVKSSQDLAQIVDLRDDLVAAKACSIQTKLPVCEIFASNEHFHLFQAEIAVKSSQDLAQIVALRDDLVAAKSCAPMN